MTNPPPVGKPLVGFHDGIESDIVIDKNDHFHNCTKTVVRNIGGNPTRKPTRGFPTMGSPSLFDGVGAFKSITTNKKSF